MFLLSSEVLKVDLFFRCVVAVIRHGDRTPKQKMKMEVRHPKFFELYHKYGGNKKDNVKLKKPTQLQEILDVACELYEEKSCETTDSKYGAKEPISKLII